jgi:hypothetical protein
MLHVAITTSAQVSTLVQFNFALTNSSSNVYSFGDVECYLQVKLPSGPSTCPFCSRPTLDARYQASISSTAKSSNETDLQSSPAPPIPISSGSSSPATPISSSPPSTNSTPVVVSIAERQQLEQAMQSQRVGSEYSTPIRTRSRSSSAGTTSGGRRGHSSRSGSHRSGGSRRHNHRSSSERHGGHPFSYNEDNYGEDFQDELEDDEDFVDNMRFNLDQVEEMMLMEAIRLSMLESEASDETKASHSVLPPPPPLPLDSKKEHNSESNLKSAGIEDEKLSSGAPVGESSISCGGPSHDEKNEDVKEDIMDCNEDEDGNYCQRVGMRGGDDFDDDESHMLELALSLSMGISSTTNASNVSGNVKEGSPTIKNEPLNDNISSSIIEGEIFISGLVEENDAMKDTVVTNPQCVKVEESGESLTPSAKRLMDKIDIALSESSQCTEERDSGNRTPDIIHISLFGDDSPLTTDVPELVTVCAESPSMFDIENNDDDKESRSNSSVENNDESDDDVDVRIIKHS